MKVGFLGAGRLAQSIGTGLMQAGHDIALTNSRGPASMSELVAELGPRASAIDVQALKHEVDVVILAVRWWQREDALSALADWAGIIVVDTLNNRTGPNPEDVIDLGDTTSSEIVAGLVPGARLVKALNHAKIPLMAEPAGGALFYCGDDSDAKAIVATLLADLGGVPIDTGGLREGGLLQGTERSLAGGPRLLTPAEARQRLSDAREAEPGSPRKQGS